MCTRESKRRSLLCSFTYSRCYKGRKEGKLPGPPPGALCAAAPQMPRRRLLKQMSPLLPQIPVPSTDALLLTRRTPTHPVRPDFCMSTGAGPPQNPGTEGAPLGCGFGPLQLFSRDTPRCPPGSSRAALVSSGMRSRARTLLAVCPPCVCVCVCVFLQCPCSSRLCKCSSHPRRRCPKQCVRTQAGVWRAHTRLSLHRRLHHPGRAKIGIFHVPCPPADVPTPRPH